MSKVVINTVEKRRVTLLSCRHEIETTTSHSIENNNCNEIIKKLTRFYSYNSMIINRINILFIQL